MRAAGATERGLAAGAGVLSLGVLAAMAWLLLCQLSEDRGRALDDAFITYVYARNVAEGHGIRYNADDPEPTEGSSSLLHVWGAAAAIRAGLDPLAATRGASVALFLVVPLALGLAVARAAAVPLGAGLLAATAAHVLWALLPETRWHLTTGMETVAFASVHAALVAWALALVFRRAPPGAGAALLGTILLLALVLLRPEGVVLAGATLAAVPLCRMAARTHAPAAEEARGFASVAVLFAVGVAASLAWKTLVFGDPIPNAYWVKSHNQIFGSSSGVLPGALEVAQFLAARFVPLAALALLVLAPARAGRAGLGVAVLAAPALGVELLYARAIHEVAGGFRYAYPLLAPLFAALAFGVALGWRRDPRAVAAACGVAVVALPLLLTDASSPLFRWLRAPAASATAWIGYEYDDDGLAKLGLDLGETELESDGTVLLSGAGLVPWYSRFHAVDWIGLNTDALSGQRALTIDEVWELILERPPDVVYSFLPPASPGARTPEEDPAFDAPTIRSSLAGRGSKLLSHWDPARVREMFWREMRYVRDHTVFGACYPLWGDWVLLAYVRRDSPHRETLERVLSRSARAGCDRPDLARLYVNDPRLHRGKRPRSGRAQRAAGERRLGPRPDGNRRTRSSPSSGGGRESGL